MKPILTLFALACFFASCNQYQYLTVSGVNVAKNEKKELIYENDSVRVVYGFSEKAGHVSVGIYNKTDQPVEIDWQKSSFVVNTTAVSYHDTKATFAGRVENDRVPDPLFLKGREVNGTILLNDPVQFIPPKSSIQRKVVAISINPKISWPGEAMKRSTYNPQTGENVSYRELRFQDEQSPLRLRSYLILRIGRGETLREFILDHEFFVSEVWTSNSGPEYFTSHLNGRNDIFYSEQ